MRSRFFDFAHVLFGKPVPTFPEHALALDKVYYDDFCSLSRWVQKEKMTEQKIDFNQLTWPDALKAIDPKLVDAPPPPC